MARYFTADLHLGHRNIIEYSSLLSAALAEHARGCWRQAA